MERIDPATVRLVDRQRWRNGDPWASSTVVVSVGQLGDRWFVRMYGGGYEDGARAYGPEDGEWYARGTARRWMRTVGGEWAEA